MATITFERAHHMGLDDARAATQRIADEMRSDYGVDSRWEGDALVFTRSGLSGVLNVSADTIRLEAKLGFLFSTYKARIAEHLDRNFSQYYR